MTAHLLLAASALDAYLVPAGVGFGVAVVCLIVAVLFRRSSRKRRGFTYQPPKTTGMDDDSYANRRASVRREGKPVRVVLSSPAFRNGTDNGYVLDRSTGGLRVATESAMAPGSTLLVRATNAPESVPWVTVIVRNCKNAGPHYELGCEFDRTPPWNVLLLFG